MIKIINNSNMKEFSNKIIKAEKEYFPMLGYKKMGFHTRILNNHKLINTEEKQSADFMTNHWRIIDYLDNDDYCLYHLFTTDSTPDILMTTMIIPSNFDRRYTIVKESIKNIIKWAKELNTFKSFKIQVLEYGELQIYPSLAYYLIPLLTSERFEPQYGIYLKKNSESGIIPQVLDSNFYIKKGKENNVDDVIRFYYQSSFNNYFLCDSLEEMQEIKNTDIFFQSLITIRNNKDDIIGAIFADKDEEGKVWLDNLAVSDHYLDHNIGLYLIYEELNLLRKSYVDRDIFVYTYREYKQSVADYESYGFEGFEYWVDLLYTIKE